MFEILLINVHSLKNAGDAALTQVAVDQIEANFPNTNVTLVLDDPEDHSEYLHIVSSLNAWLKPTDNDGNAHWSIPHILLFIPLTIIPLIIYRIFNFRFFPLTPRNLRKLLNAYFDAEIIISQPGGFLYSSGRGFVLLVNLYSLNMALIAGKPLYIFPQSFGPFFQNWEKVLVKWTLSRARIVMAREPESYELLNSIGIPKSKSFLIPDLAFAFHGQPKAAGEKSLLDHGINSDQTKPLLGITVINWSAENKRFLQQEEYENAIASAARFFIEQYDGITVFFTQVSGPSLSQDDRIPTRRVITQLRDLSESVLFIEEPISADILKPIYGFMDIFIGTRMHSNIFAVGEGVPVIAIGYQHKTKGIMEMMNLEPWTIDINSLGVEQLQLMLSSLWNKRNFIQENLYRSVPNLADQANQAGKIILRDYNRLQEHTH
jgi:colanic acid/amylovoran biosynthesis protein